MTFQPEIFFVCVLLYLVLFSTVALKKHLTTTQCNHERGVVVVVLLSLDCTVASSKLQFAHLEKKRLCKPKSKRHVLLICPLSHKTFRSYFLKVSNKKSEECTMV